MSTTILSQVQLPPEPVPTPAPVRVWGEIPQPGTVTNTWTLQKPVTAGIDLFWNGLHQFVGGDFTFTLDGTGTLLTLTPAAIAVNAWTTGNLVANYE